MQHTTPTAAYIHIPFCRRRCFYCDFAIYVVGDGAMQPGKTLDADRQPPQSVITYLAALQAEIQNTAPQNTAPLQTIFFGGGTPSMLSGTQLAAILSTLNQQFPIAPDAEVSMEIDPGTFSFDDLKSYQAAGVNRFSFGTQTFQPDLLAACGRAHTIDDIQQAMAMVQTAGIDNYSLDLISGLPNQTIAQWEADLAQAIAYRPTHISTYDLTIEPGTVFGKRYRPGDRPLPSDEITAQMYRIAHHRLTAAGYEHYEISNYAKPGYQCQHNRTYWKNDSFYGFGMGATSYLQGERFARPRQLQAYFDWVETLPSDAPDNRSSPQEQLLDTLMVGFRLAEGVNLAHLRQRFDPHLLDQISQCLTPYIKPGWLEAIGPNGAQQPTVDHTTQIVRLTAPEGFLFSNVVLVKLFDRLDTD